MTLSKEERASFIELVNQPGWKFVEAWLTEREKLVTDAVKKNFVNLKWEEAPKWSAYYSGQCAVLDSFRAYKDFQVNLSFKKEEHKEKKDAEE